MRTLALYLVLSTFLLFVACAESDRTSPESRAVTAVAASTVSIEEHLGLPATVAAAFTATAESMPSPIPAPTKTPPDLPATVAVAFTATAMAAPTPTANSSPPYIPQLSDYLTAVDPLVEGDKIARTEVISRFDAVTATYWLNIIRLAESPSRVGFIEFVPKALNVRPASNFTRNSLGEFALVELQMLAALAMEPDHPEIIDSLIWAPSDAEALLICRVGVLTLGTSALSRHDEWKLPPEPMCPVVIAEYRAYGSESELGFLGHVADRLLLGKPLLPDSELTELTPTIVPLAAP